MWDSVPVGQCASGTPLRVYLWDSVQVGQCASGTPLRVYLWDRDFGGTDYGTVTKKQRQWGRQQSTVAEWQCPWNYILGTVAEEH